jgi:hypothetical protein
MRVPLLVAAALTLSATTASAEVRLSMQAGRVSLSAKNATVAQILAEWARVGQTRIVNGERLTSTPMTIELTDVSERDALEILLRNASGYVLAPRTGAAEAASVYDRILIVPTSSAPRAAAPPPIASPGFQSARPAPVDNDEVAPVNVPRFVAPMPGETNAQPSQGQPAPAPASPVPTAPVGVARPGMMVPVPPTTPPRQSPTANPE